MSDTAQRIEIRTATLRHPGCWYCSHLATPVIPEVTPAPDEPADDPDDTTVPDDSPSDTTPTEPQVVNNYNTYHTTQVLRLTADQVEALNKLAIYVQDVYDENNALVAPHTILQAVTNLDGKTLDVILSDIDKRLSEVEVADGSPITLRVADNLLTESRTAALSARQGVLLKALIDSNLTTTNAAIAAANAAIIGSDRIEEAAVLDSHIADAAITTDKVADAAITPDKLSDDLAQAFATLVSFDQRFTAFKTNAEARLTALETSMAEHQATDTLLREQNQYLLNLHHAYKVLTVAAMGYDPQTTDYAETVALDDIRMSGLKLQYSWKFEDTRDTDPARPDQVNVTAYIDYTPKPILDDETGDPVLDDDGNPTYTEPAPSEVRPLSTDRALSGINQTAILRNLTEGCTITVKTIIKFAWLEWTDQKVITVTE